MPGFLLQSDALDNMKEQLREQTRTIADLKQNLMVLYVNFIAVITLWKKC